MIRNILAELYFLIFAKEIEAEDIRIIDLFCESTPDPTAVIGFFVDNTLVTFLKVGAGESVHGPVLDSAMLDLVEIAKSLKEHKDYNHERTDIVLFTTKSPMGLARWEEEYMTSRFSPVQGPSNEVLESYNISPEYVVIDLPLNPEINELFDQLLDMIDKDQG